MAGQGGGAEVIGAIQDLLLPLPVILRAAKNPAGRAARVGPTFAFSKLMIPWPISCHCEERSDEAIQLNPRWIVTVHFVHLALTDEKMVAAAFLKTR
jgi:hypothetical protein